MRRDATPYAAQRAFANKEAYGARAFKTDEPTAGFYAMRMVAGGVLGGIEIWHGPPRDPVTGEIMDRSWRWQATFNGEYIDLDWVWPICAKRPIDRKEYDRLVNQFRWAVQNAPDSAYANPYRKHYHNDAANPLPF